MPTRAELVARLVAARLSALVRDLPAVVLNAAPEFCTREIARELARQRFASGYVEILGEAAVSSQVRDELRRGNPISVRSTSPTVITVGSTSCIRSLPLPPSHRCA